MEIWDAYTVGGLKTGETLVRGEPIPAGRYHLVCEVLVRHADGSFLVMERSREKPNFPGFWEATAGGSALAGEDALTCVCRELREETGIDCQEFTALGCHVSDNTIYQEFLATVSCPKDSVTLQPGETQGYRWLCQEEFKALLVSDKCCPGQRRRNRDYYVEMAWLPADFPVALTVAELVDAGICPTCYDRSHGHALYGDASDKRLYEDDILDCILVGNPRAPGHTTIISKTHYKDMMEAPEEITQPMFAFARRCAIAIRQVYGAESVYLCTMCDGPMNHFHLQLIPRYGYEKRGSKNFVKPRQEYLHDPEKLQKLREILKEG